MLLQDNGDFGISPLRGSYQAQPHQIGA